MGRINFVKEFKNKIKKIDFVMCPVEIQPIRPILGRIYAIYLLLKCIKLFKFSCYGYKFYRISLPKLVKVGE